MAGVFTPWGLTGNQWYSVPTDNWEADLSAFCGIVGDENCAGFYEYPESGRLSTKLLDHANQGTLLNSFGSYIEQADWNYPLDDYETLSTPWALDQVTDFPLTLIVGEEDTSCELQYAYETMDKMSNVVRGLYNIEGADHMFFVNNTHPEFIDIVKREVQASVEDW